MVKSANFHSHTIGILTIAVQETAILQMHGVKQFQDFRKIVTLDALEQVHVPPRGRPSVQHKGRVHIYFD